jgi:hypothetical protein
VTAEALRAALLTVQAAGNSWTLEAEAWRSFQPIRGEPGDPAIVVLRLKGQQSVPPQLSATGVWLVRGSEVWAGEAREEQPRGAGATQIEFVARNGPQWPTGDSVDVVLGIEDGTGGVQLLRAPRIVIARVD